ncbi:MAG: glycosyltransferase [Candidatus Contendobacter sp.]
MRVIALLATYNEERFISACLDHLVRQEVEVYLIDNESRDRTVAIAERYQGQGVIAIETFPRHGRYSWRPILERKEQLAARLEADWFIHLDTDEIRLPPCSDLTLAQALADVDSQGYNAVNFMEFTFVPTRQNPDHDHPDFQNTMRRYYPFLPSFPHRLNAWKSQPGPIELAWSGGHRVRFPGLRLYPVSFPMRHYLFLSVPHAIQKYVQQSYDPVEVATGWHRARAQLQAEHIRLQDELELLPYLSDDRLDPANPRKKHPLFTKEQ